MTIGKKVRDSYKKDKTALRKNSRNQKVSERLPNCKDFDNNLKICEP